MLTVPWRRRDGTAPCPKQQTIVFSQTVGVGLSLEAEDIVELEEMKSNTGVTSKSPVFGHSVAESHRG